MVFSVKPTKTTLNFLNLTQKHCYYFLLLYYSKTVTLKKLFFLLKILETKSETKVLKEFIRTKNLISFIYIHKTKLKLPFLVDFTSCNWS